jgi:hypothetical protein
MMLDLIALLLLVTYGSLALAMHRANYRRSRTKARALSLWA